MMPIYYIKQRRSSRKKLFIVFLFLGLLIVFIYLSIRTFSKKSSSENILGESSEITDEGLTPYPTLPAISPTPNDLAPSTPLEQVVQAALIGTHGSYGIVVKNLKTGENYSLNEHVSYNSASLYKLWVMAEAYRQIKSGALKEDQILSEEYKTLNAKFGIDPKTAEFKDGTLTLSVKDALNKMITISDNYAALLLTLKIRLANVASFLKVNGFSRSKVGTNGNDPTTTAYDTALFFEKLYKAELIDKECSDEMLRLLKQQRLNDKIPRYLPDDVLIVHKTGELDEYTHDAGIVYAQNADYIVVVLSKSSDPALAKNRISNISESVYNYFSSSSAGQTLPLP